MNGGAQRSAEGNNAPPANVLSPASALKNEPFFQPCDGLSFALAAALALVIYWLTLAPEVTLEFSGIFATGAEYAGVPFPPGYPVWTIYAWVFTWLLPWSNIAWRVAMSSAVAGALTCGLIALITSRGVRSILDGGADLRRLSPKSEQALRVVCGGVAGLAFGLDRAFWRMAVIAEVWPLTILLLVAVLCLLMRWMHTPDRRGWLYVAALVYGLTLTNSQALAVAGPGLVFVVLLRAPALGRDLFCAAAVLLGLALVARALGLLPEVLGESTRQSPVWRFYLRAECLLLPLCVVLTITTRGIFTERKALAVSAMMLALGLTPYLYAPFASMTNPPINWAYPRTFEGFLHLVSRGQFESVRPTGSWSAYAEQLGRYAQTTINDFGLIYMLLACVPLWFIRRLRAEARQWLFGLLGVYACLSLITVALVNASADTASQGLVAKFFTASHLVLALMCGCGLGLLGTIITRSGRQAGKSGSE